MSNSNNRIRDVWEFVLLDIEARRLRGIESYGAPLTVQTPVDPLWEAYCEALDLVVYLRTEIEKRKSNVPQDNNFLS